jgi:hypothetical protein
MGKGGGYAHHVIAGRLAPRCRWWYGTNDDPRDPVPPRDGGLPQPPNFLTRFLRGVRYYARWIRYAITLRKMP